MKLNQVIAVEKSIKTNVQKAVDTVYKAIQKPGLFDGHIKIYKKKDENGEDLPSETQKVQMSVAHVLNEVQTQLADLFNVIAQKDMANLGAVADVEVDGNVILKGVPATYLLFLEKQLTDLATLIGKLPILDPSQEWSYDASTGLFKSPETQTHRTKKVQKPLVLYPHSDKHPAQTQLITEDELVGFWHRIDFSGAIPLPERAKLFRRVETLRLAIKQAREKANLVEAPKQDIGKTVLAWIFPDKQ